MTIIIFILPMNALKRLIAVIAGFVKAIRRRLREAVLFHAETGVAEKTEGLFDGKAVAERLEDGKVFHLFGSVFGAVTMLVTESGEDSLPV